MEVLQSPLYTLRTVHLTVLFWQSPSIALADSQEIVALLRWASSCRFGLQCVHLIQARAVLVLTVCAWFLTVCAWFHVWLKQRCCPLTLGPFLISFSVPAFFLTILSLWLPLCIWYQQSSHLSTVWLWCSTSRILPLWLTKPDPCRRSLL